MGKNKPNAYNKIITSDASIKALTALSFIAYYFSSIFISDKCNFNASVERKISNKNRSIEIIIEIQQLANINLAIKIVSKYKHNTVIILNKNPKLAAPMAYFK